MAFHRPGYDPNLPAIAAVFKSTKLTTAGLVEPKKAGTRRRRVGSNEGGRVVRRARFRARPWRVGASRLEAIAGRIQNSLFQCSEIVPSLRTE